MRARSGAVAAQVVASPWPSILWVLAILLTVLLLVALARYRRRPSRGAALVAIAIAVGVVTVGAAYAYAAHDAYVLENTWTFGYFLSIQGNGTAPESVVVPIPTNEGLLWNLHLTGGSANWSLVDTPQGRGLFVRFAGSASLEATVSIYPMPDPGPDTGISLPASGNCTAQPSNCTGSADVWIFYSGPAGAAIALSIDGRYLGGYLETGWSTYGFSPPAVP